MVNGQSPVKLTFHYGAIEPILYNFIKSLPIQLTFHYGAIEPEKVINPRTKAKN